MRVLYKLHTIHLKLPEFLIDRNFHAAIPLAIYHVGRRSSEIIKLLEDPSYRAETNGIISSASRNTLNVIEREV